MCLYEPLHCVAVADHQRHLGPGRPVEAVHQLLQVAHGCTGMHVHDDRTVLAFAEGVMGAAARTFLKFRGSWYPGPILDNTQINAALREALGLSALGRHPRQPD